MRVKTLLPSFSGSLDFGLFRGFCLGEQAGHGRSVGSLHGNGASVEFSLQSWIRCHLRHQSEARQAFLFAAHFERGGFMRGSRCDRARQMRVQGFETS